MTVGLRLIPRHTYALLYLVLMLICHLFLCRNWGFRYNNVGPEGATYLAAAIEMSGCLYHGFDIILAFCSLLAFTTRTAATVPHCRRSWSASDTPRSSTFRADWHMVGFVVSNLGPTNQDHARPAPQRDRRRGLQVARPGARTERLHGGAQPPGAPATFDLCLDHDIPRAVIGFDTCRLWWLWWLLGVGSARGEGGGHAVEQCERASNCVVGPAA